MGYDLHIVRTIHWSDSSSDPITKAEVDRLMASDPSLSWSASDHSDMQESDATIVRYFYIKWNGDSVFWWYRSEIIGKNPTEQQIVKLAQIAQALNARLLGDDGERYMLRKSLWGKPKVVISQT